MVMDNGALTSTGKHIADPICGDGAQCLAHYDIVAFFRDYHPASHLLPLLLAPPARDSSPG
ncbi:hypothetical protein PV396_25895 [Streptomyces sp. ME02-8801-2C]|uniref:hypothetical protein n=1 Tax=Streptomyces sp. ME02-8801-2C TaxID=3028680 RepID=UPI0029AB532F|nr:hypothetical protein [Streptomyces sp. ME02-8801-2C]MDX3455329.1 hypothetical protein [Streptomyces sp. ME02-8801-2C]